MKLGVGASAWFHKANDILVERNFIHKCGRNYREGIKSNVEHAFYLDAMENSVIRDNIIQEIKDNAFKPAYANSESTQIYRNLVRGQVGTRVDWGSFYSSDVKNMDTHSNIIEGTLRYSQWQANLTSAASNNRTANNCMSTTGSSYYGHPVGIMSSMYNMPSVFNISGNVSAVGQTYTGSPSNGTLRLAANSPCVGYGPAFIQPD